MATLTVYPTAGDGNINCERGGSTWDAVHDETGTTDVVANYITSEHSIVNVTKVSDTQYYIYRGFLPFDTSALGSGTTINTALLSLYVTTKSNGDNDGDDFVGIVQTTQASSASLVAEDYDQCGSINTPTEGATRIDIGNLTTSAYNAWTLNATGLTWIDPVGITYLGAREGHDIVDSPNVSSNSVNIRFSEYADTTNDPKLVITYNYVTSVQNFRIYTSDWNIDTD